MKWSDLPLHPAERTLRRFAALWLALLGGLAAWEWVFRERPGVAAALATLSLTLGPLGLWRPNLVRPIYVGGVVIGFPASWLLSHVSLAVIFYLVVTPLGLSARLLGRDRLSLRRRAGETTNWSSLDESNDVRRYFRQF